MSDSIGEKILVQTTATLVTTAICAIIGTVIAGPVGTAAGTKIGAAISGC